MRESLSTKKETIKVCHIVLDNIRFFRLLQRTDVELAMQTHAVLCDCGGKRHRGNYPRKPRVCPDEVRADYASRFSFCCSQCRKRSTSQSVRFLGRRVYLGLVVVLMSIQQGGQGTAQARCSATLNVARRTLARWCDWWVEDFPLTPLWRAEAARHMPPVVIAALPASLIERFTGLVEASFLRLLVFLAPLTASDLVTLQEVR